MGKEAKKTINTVCMRGVSSFSALTGQWNLELSHLYILNPY